tara:strand:- start:177 stop:1868 length:1692 start_codon:yes stop_codon:yes gene_type:complete
MVVPLLLLASVSAAPTTVRATPTTPTVERDQTTVQTGNAPFDVFAAEVQRLLSRSGAGDLEIRPDGVPHVLVFLDAKGDKAPDVFQTIRDLANNYGYNAAYQATSEQIGLVISPPFLSLSLCWETHPGEDVPSADRLWRTPFADMDDFSIEVAENGALFTLVVSDEAAKRIDSYSEIQGHRRYFIRFESHEVQETAGPYIWIPGVKQIPVRVPLARTLAIYGKGEHMLGRLLGEFTSRSEARKLVEARLSLDGDTDWVAPPMQPRYTSEFQLWTLTGEDWAGEPPCYAPWSETADGSTPWLALRPGPWSDVSIALPPAWRTEGASAIGEDGASLVLARDITTPYSEEMARFLQGQTDRELAVLMQGRVIGIVSAEQLKTGRLTLANLSHGQNAKVMTRWNRYAGVAPPSTTAGPATGGDGAAESFGPILLGDDFDFFQVRLMAEPQERKLIPVTHFPAPGAARGVLVAVQNDVILDSHAVTGARLENKADRLLLHLSLTAEGLDALSGACFANLGKQLAILYEDQLICAPTIVDWEQEELTFKGLNDDWPEVARAMVARLGNS